MARRKKRSGMALVDGTTPSSGVGGPTASKRRRRGRVVPGVQLPSPIDLSSAGPAKVNMAPRKCRKKSSKSSTSSDPPLVPTAPRRRRKKSLKSASFSSPPAIAPATSLEPPLTSAATSWSAYFHEVGLLGASVQAVDRFRKYTSSQLNSVKQNFARFTTKDPKRRVQLPEYTAPMFNLKDTVQNSKKAQPDEIKLPDFEELNEPTLKLITDTSCIIRDNSGEPLVLKVGSMPMYRNDPTKPAIPSALAASLFHHTLVYLCTASCTQDPTRHGGKKDSKTTEHQSHLKARKGGPVPRPPVDRGQCHHIHAQHCARNDNEIEDIQLFRGPRDTWDTRTKDGPINSFLHHLQPLTQLLEVIFRVILGDCWQVYENVRRKMPLGLGGLGVCFGIWRSRSIVIDAVTNIHRDLQDVCYGWCAIVPLGDFQGGDVCLPSLGFKVVLPIGSVLFLRSYAVPHYVGQWTGHRFSIVHFSHQTTFDFFAQESGERLHLFGNMPEWWRTNRQDGPNMS